MIKRVDKKGISTNEVWMIIALVVLVIALVFIFRGQAFAEQGLTTFSVDMIDGKVTACSLHATPLSKKSFCDYRYLKKNTYMNCMYKEVYDRLLEGDLTAGEINALGCPEEPAGSKAFCESICKGEETNSGDSIKFSEKITVNGQTCASLGVDDEACEAMKGSFEGGAGGGFGGAGAGGDTN